jgi:hypothetical protein
MDEFDRRIRSNLLNKSTISLLAVIEASDSHLGPRPERDHRFVPQVQKEI